MTPEYWLNIATHGLAPHSAERVRTEHLAHLEDALEAGESVGEVLQEWGDPHRANAELKKAHLTTREARYLPAGYAPTLRGLGQALWEDIVLLGFFSFATLFFSVQGQDNRFQFGLLAAMWLAPLLRWLCLSRSVTPILRAWLHWILQPLTFCFGAVILSFSWATLLTEGQWLRSKLTEPSRGLYIFTFSSLYQFSKLLTAVSAARKTKNEVELG